MSVKMAGHTGYKNCKIQSRLIVPFYNDKTFLGFETYSSYLGSFLLIKEEMLKRKLVICSLTHKPTFIWFKRELKHRTCLSKVYTNQEPPNPKFEYISLHFLPFFHF